MAVAKLLERWGLWIIFGLAVVIYANTLSHGYVQDDAIVITENAFTTQGISGIPGLLKHDPFYGFFEDESKAGLVAGGRYRPFTPVMFAIEYELFGLNPFIGHLVNVLLYAISCVLVLLVMRNLLSGRMRAERILPVAFAATLFFVVHPVHTEAVANIKGRDEIMALLGGLLAFYLLLQKEPLTILRWLAVFAAFSMGLFSKENAIIFVAAVPLALVLLKKKSIKDALMRSSPLFIAAIIFLIVRQSVLGMGLAGDPPMELMNNPFLKWDGGRYIPFTGAEKAGTILVILFYYLRLMIIPWPLTHDYYPRQIDIYQLTDPLPLLSLLIIVGLITITLLNLRKNPLLSFGLLFFAMALFPYTNILFPIGTNLSERFLYTPSVGISFVLAWGLNAFFKRRKKLTAAPFYAIGMLCAILAVITFNRNFAWKDNYTLFTTDIHTSTRSAKLHNAVAGELSTRSPDIFDEAERNSKLERALVHTNTALEIHPRYKNAMLIRGNILFYLRRFEEAIEAYQQALMIDPQYEDARRNMGIAYRDGGRYFGEQMGNIPRALEFLELAAEVLPDDYETLRLLGVAHGFSGNHQNAISYFQRAANAEPELAQAWFNLGTAYMASGDIERGQHYHDKAREMDPEIEEKMRSNAQ